MQRVAARGDVLFRQIRIGAALQEQFHDLHMSRRGGVAQRRTGAGVIGYVVRGPVRQRRILREQFADTFEISDK